MNAFVTRDICPLCKTRKFKNLYSVKYSDYPMIDFLNQYYAVNKIDFSFLNNEIFCVEECLSCGLIFQKNILSDQNMKIFYGEWLTLPYETEINHPTEYYIGLSNEIKNISYRFGREQKYKVLDFGAGWGEWSFMAKSYGAEVFAVELSENKCSYLSKNGIHILNWDEISKHQFNFINTEQVFEHISDPLEVFSYLVKQLTKDGIIKLSVPNGTRVANNLKKPEWFADRNGVTSLMPIHPLEHINCYTKKSIAVLANKFKLKQVKTTEFNLINTNIEKVLKNIIYPFYRYIFNKQDYILCHYYQNNN